MAATTLDAAEVSKAEGSAKTALTLTLALLGLFGAGCDRASEAHAALDTRATRSAVQDEAQDVFLGRCASCHGYQGHGDGPSARDLKVRPADLSRGDWQRGVTDEQLRKLIVQGGPALGKSAEMPANPDLGARAELVDALISDVRRLAR
jgi:mono/diheme cytochrome c family protein